MRECEPVRDLYHKSKKAGVKPKQFLLQHALEAGMRLHDTDFIYEVLKDCLEHECKPHRRQLGALANIKSMPDDLYVLLRSKFHVEGKVGAPIRKFPLATFRPGKEGMKMAPTTNYKRTKLKKHYTKMSPKTAK